MPTIKNESVLKFGKKTRLFLNMEAGLTGLGAVVGQIKSRLGTKAPRPRPRAKTSTAPPKVTWRARRRKHKATPEEAREAITKVGKWRHRIEVASGVITPGTQNSERKLAMLKLPEHLDGKRILDIGASDGYFSFVAESRGAEVLAIDRVPPDQTGFETAASLLGSSVEYRTMNVYDLSPEELGTFDGILFLGVLYHLRHPMLGLDRLWSVARPGATVWIESFVLDGHVADPKTGERRGDLASLAPGLARIPVAQFYPGSELFGVHSNWWGPNLAALKAMVESAGFTVTRVLAEPSSPTRAIVVGRKEEHKATLSLADSGAAEHGEVLDQTTRGL